MTLSLSLPGKIPFGVNVKPELETSQNASGNSNKYILCMMDALTKYADVLHIPDKSAQTVSDKIFTNWICRFGLPIQIHSEGVNNFQQAC